MLRLLKDLGTILYCLVAIPWHNLWAWSHNRRAERYRIRALRAQAQIDQSNAQIADLKRRLGK